MDCYVVKSPVFSLQRGKHFLDARAEILEKKLLAFWKTSIFQIFWKDDCCPDFLFFGVRDLRTSP